MPYANELFLIGRILFGGYFLMNAYHHVTKHAMMSGYATSKGVPAAGLAVAVSGLLLLAGGLGVLLGVYVRWAVLALVVFLVPVTFTMHAYWKATDPMAKMGDQAHFWKNTALIGATLMLLAIPEPWAYTQ